MRRIREGDPAGYRRVLAAIERLADDPLPQGAVKLKGFDPPAWRLRVGDYRIVYEVHRREVTVVVINVAPRGEVYR